ncbi:o-succinylbenzoate synthase [Celerinatantimonas sp. YJH-8]|uniref:o-succinylbenzoate synthase n=1 Tax=Celerinatantimonas sp. YJH-8 TaxID=3228714 RepID=UPI0038C4FF05
MHLRWQLKLFLVRTPWHCPWDPRQRYRRTLQVELHQNGDLFGLGEIAPLPGFSQESLTDCYHAFCVWLTDKSRPLPPAVAWARQCALKPFPGILPIPVSYPLLQGFEAQILNKLQHWSGPIFRAKLKVARQPLAADIALIKKIVALKPQIQLRLDANQRWTRQESLTFCRAIPMSSVEYLEQPCADIGDCQALAVCGYPIALDESLYQASHLPDYFPGLKALVLKPTLLGERLTPLLKMAAHYQLGISISSSYETAAGLSHLVQLAQATGDRHPGLDTLGALTGPSQRRLLKYIGTEQNPLLD